MAPKDHAQNERPNLENQVTPIPQNEPTAGNTQALRGNTRAVIISTIVAVIVLLIPAIFNSIQLVSQANRADELLARTLVGIDAAEILEIDGALRENPVIAGPTVHIRGTLKKPLPSGAQIWTGSEPVFSAQYPGSPTGGFGVDAGGPCSANARTNTFDCGEVVVGNNTTDKSKFAIFVGLATSDDARGLVDQLKTQIAKGLYGRTPPADMVWLPPLRMSR